MRATVLSVVFIAILPVGRAWAADSAPAATKPHFDLPEIGDKPAAPRFTPAQIAYVQSWIRQKAPECPVEASAAVAQNFLEQLQVSQPDKLDRLLSPDFPARQFDSLLLRSAGAKLSGAGQAPLREKIAEHRVAVLLAQEGRGAADAPAQIAKIRDASDFQYRRLLEGRLEDDELLLLLRKSGQAATAPRAPAPAAPKVLTATEIVSEYARHNQVGTAMLRLQTFALEGRLTTATGQVQQLQLFKMRPDRFRLVLREGGLSLYLLGADNDIFWQQFAGQRPQVAQGKDVGSRRYLAEFTDPLFAREGYAFELLPEGAEAGKKFYRIGVKRADGSGYVARIEPGTFREVGREDADQSVTHYSDFHELAGVTFAYREEITGRDGRKAVLEISRAMANPGLIRDFFHPAPDGELDYFHFEPLVSRVLTDAGRPAPAK